MDKWYLEENKKGRYYWSQTSQYFHSKDGLKCSRCKKIRHHLMRINYPKACTEKTGESGAITKGFPSKNPYNDWVCKRCWSSCPMTKKREQKR